MIGDIILYIKKVVKQMFCIHNYQPDRIGIITGLNLNLVCKKCGKWQ